MGNKYTSFNYTPQMYDKDKSLVDAVHSRVPYLGRGRTQDAFELAKIFKEYGYKGLRVASNESPNAFVSLDRLSSINPERIIRVAQEMYVQANKRMSSFGNPLKNPKSPFCRKIQTLEGKIEEDGQICIFS